MQGPARELCDVVFFPVGQARGLHMVHHTCRLGVFPGLHIVLLDSDCVPVTLFEVEDLWREAQRLQHSGFPGPVPTSSWAGGILRRPIYSLRRKDSSCVVIFLHEWLKYHSATSFTFRDEELRTSFQFALFHSFTLANHFLSFQRLLRRCISRVSTKFWIRQVACALQPTRMR